MTPFIHRTVLTCFLQLDSARIAASKMSPMMETVNYVSLDPVEVKAMYQSTN